MKHNKYKWMFFKSVAMAYLVLGCSSCADDEEVSSMYNQKPSDVVTFSFSTSGEWEPDVLGRSAETDGSTSSRTEALPMESEDGAKSEDIYMYMMVEDCPEVVDTVEVDSRAVGDAEYGIYAFDIASTEEVSTYDPTSTTLFMNNIALDETGAYVKKDQTAYWPGAGHWLKFFAYTPYTDNDAAKPLTISPENGYPVMSYTVPTDVTQQVDLMGGAAVDMRSGSNVTGNVEITMQHLLSQIEVKVGTIDVGTINSVTFTNIKSTGTYQLNGTSPITWSNISAEQTYIITNDVTSEDKGESVSIPFYFIPQEIDENAEITVNLEVQNAGTLNESTGEGTVQTFTLSRKLKDFTTEWSADKKYTFVLSTPEEVEIEVTDQLSNDRKTKSNLVIKNTGLSSCYVRAAIVGSWVIPNETETYEDDIIVADWKFDPTDQSDPEKNDGTFVWGATLKTDKQSAQGNGWFRHTDGYYYYMKELKKDEVAPKLFDSYTLTAEPPVADAVLDLTILVQAVLTADVAAAWSDFAIEDFQ